MKKFCALLLALTMLVSLSACGTKYEDTNGDADFSLQTITDQDIIHLRTGASGLSYSESSLGDIITSAEYSSKNFNGVEQLYLNNFIAPSDIIVYVSTLSVTSGNFRLVVINNDEIIFDIPLDTFNEQFYFENLTGSVSIHAAGESAACSFHLEVN